MKDKSIRSSFGLVINFFIGPPKTLNLMCADQLFNGDDGGSGLVAIDVVFELFAELLDEAQGGHGCCVAERAEGAAHHVFGEVLDVIHILARAAAVVDAGEGLLDPVGALSAGEAPAARPRLVA